MKNKRVLFGILAITLVLVMTAVGCDDSADDKGGSGSFKWNATTSSSFFTGTANGLYAFAYGNGKFVAVGYGGKTDYSPDGITWTPVTPSPFNASIEAIAFGNNKFVAGGKDAKTSTSTDGITWTSATTISGFANSYNQNRTINAIAFGNGKFVAVGEEGKTSTSTDGTTWTAVTTVSGYGTTDEINAIAYGNNKFVAGGSSGKMAYSSDGVTWTAVGDSILGTYVSSSSGQTYTSGINTIVYANNKFVAGGGGGKWRLQRTA